MSKLFLILIPITLLAAISLGIIALTFNPDKSEGSVKLLFFASFSAFLWGCGAIVFFLLNFWVNDRMNDALRRGFFVAMLGLALVILRKQGLLYWHTGFVSIIIIMLMEFWIYKAARVTIEEPNGE